MSTIFINGKVISTGAGGSISINGDVVKINGKRVDLDRDTKVFNIVVTGDVDSIKTESSDITVNGSVNTAETVSGDVNVAGDVKGSVATISGDVKAKGGVYGSTSTVSGDIRNK